MYNPIISIIIPVYNVEKYLSKCIESVCMQSYTNLEIILVDDGATDRSSQICDIAAQMDKRIKVIHKNNGGLSSARNTGLANMTGDYVAFVDSDDYVHIDYIKKLYFNLINFNADFSVCSYKKIIKDEKYDFKSKSKNVNIFEVDLAKVKILSRQIPIYAHGKLFKSYLIPHLQFPEKRLYEDIPTIWNVLKHISKVSYTSEKLYFYRQRENSIVNSKFEHRRMDQLYFAERILSEINKNNTILYNAAISRCFFSAMDNYILVTKEFDNDRKYLLQSIKKYSSKLKKDKYIDNKLFLMAKLASLSPTIAYFIGKQYKKLSFGV